jgi:hypothetical protein
MPKRAVVVCALSVALAALLQLGLTASTGGGLDARALPVLPLAALAAWAAARGAAEAWAGLLPAPIVLGLASSERVGWFLLALALTPLLASAFRGQGDARDAGAALHTVGAAGGGALVGALIYTLLLDAAAGDLPRALAASSALGVGALGTAVIAAGLGVALLPFRPRHRGLFG